MAKDCCEISSDNHFSEGPFLNPKPSKTKVRSADSIPFKLQKMLDILEGQPR
jgi:hypothetical protein